MSGDYAISVVAQLGEGSTGANWEVEMYDFTRGWVRVGDLDGGERDTSLNRSLILLHLHLASLFCSTAKPCAARFLRLYHVPSLCMPSSRNRGYGHQLYHREHSSDGGGITQLAAMQGVFSFP